ncbi:MAG: transglutaminase-like domain-containing protein [Dongiaceae bacterium]
MSEDDAVAYLEAVGRQPDAAIDLGEAALRLASLGRPQVPLDRYREHLAALAADVAAAAGGTAAGGEGDAPAAQLERQADALRGALAGKNGYRGDRLTYDDLQNANLMRVIDRRRGLPVALGILYIHAARAQGWTMDGLGFPGHFLVRLETAGGRLILDPFNDGAAVDAGALREMLKGTAGPQAELQPEHHAPVANRQVLLRLHNNLKSRLIQSDRIAEAVAVIEQMQLFAPDDVSLWRESGLCHAQLGNLGAAIAALDAFVARCTSDRQRHEAAGLIVQLRRRLN